jgi:hypothetical protein
VTLRAIVINCIALREVQNDTAAAAAAAAAVAVPVAAAATGGNAMETRETTDASEQRYEIHNWSCVINQMRCCRYRLLKQLPVMSVRVRR